MLCFMAQQTYKGEKMYKNKNATFACLFRTKRSLALALARARVHSIHWFYGPHKRLIMFEFEQAI